MVLDMVLVGVKYYGLVPAIFCTGPFHEKNVYLEKKMYI